MMEKSSDLISRADAIEAVKQAIYNHDSAIMRITSLPSAETVQGEVQGEWIEVEDDYDTVYWECSNCEDAFFIEVGTPKDNNYNFCPNCGARMYKGGEDEKVKTEMSLPNWIPCSERLPEERGEYLVSYHTNFIGECMDIMRYGKPLMPSDESDKHRNCFYDTSYDGFDCVCHEVTAWMPLPKPYERSESDEID